MARFINILTALLFAINIFSQEIREIDFQLITSAEKGDTLIIDSLLKKGANVNAKTIDGVTALMYASDYNHFKATKMLLDSGANPNLIPENSISALHSTAINGNWKIGELLIQYGANINQKNEYGITPLHYACYYKNYYFVDMLLFYGAGIQVIDNYGLNALFYAVMAEDLEIIDLLIKNGIEINSRDKNGNTVLMAAIRRESIEIVKYLVENGALINYKNNDGITPLLFAVNIDSKEICEILINNGNNIQSNSESASNLFIMAKSRELKNYLKEAGIKRNKQLVFNYFEVGFNNSNNNKDLLMGCEINLHEANYNFNLTVGYKFRPWVRPVLEGKNYEFWQYWEKRSDFSLGLNKDFKIIRNFNNNEIGINVGLKNIFTTANYLGTNVNPASFYIVSPGIGLYKRKKHTAFNIKYEYADYHLQGYTSNWLNMSFILRFNINKQNKAIMTLLNDF